MLWLRCHPHRNKINFKNDFSGGGGGGDNPETPVNYAKINVDINAAAWATKVTIEKDWGGN